MSGMPHLDTCVLSKYLDPRARERFPQLVVKVEGVIAAGGLRISRLVVYQIMRGIELLRKRGEGEKKFARVELFLRGAITYELDGYSPEVWRTAIELWTEGRRRGVNGDPEDLLILATAMGNKSVLMTADVPLARRAERLGVADSVELLPLA